MFGSIAVLFVLPWLDTSPVKSGRFRPIFRIFFVLLAVDVVVLGFVGANPPEGAWLLTGRIATAWYFLHFLVVLPLLGVFERPRPLTTSISEPVRSEGHTSELQSL